MTTGSVCWQETGERLSAAHAQLIAAWTQRAGKLAPHFPRTDILGALRLAAEIFAQEPGSTKRILVLFSDMRQSTPELDLESLRVVPPFSALAELCGPRPALRGVEVHVLGVDGSGTSSAYWESLRAFWVKFFRDVKANLKSYSILRASALLPSLK